MHACYDYLLYQNSIWRIYAYTDDTNMSSQHDRHKSIGVELFTLGDYFSICVMQPGKNPAFVKELMHSFASCSIDCKLMSEERFRLADYKLP